MFAAFKIFSISLLTAKITGCKKPRVSPLPGDVTFGLARL
jgi:hypothetical protein